MEIAGKISGGGTVALLILLARAARAGVVPADFGAGSDGFGGLGLRRACLELQILLLAPLSLFDLFGLFLRLGGLHQKQESHCLGVNAVHQLVEQGKGFLLELDQGIHLPVAAQPDALFKVVEGEQVVFPLGVHDIEQDVAFEPSQRGLR